MRRHQHQSGAGPGDTRGTFALKDESGFGTLTPFAFSSDFKHDMLYLEVVCLHTQTSDAWLDILFRSWMSSVKKMDQCEFT